MNKSELVARLTERLGGDRATATAAVDGILEEIQGSVANGERVSLPGFGTFDRRERAARTGRNPRTGAAIQLPASVSPVFRPGTGFRSLLGSNGHSPAESAVPPPVVAAEPEAIKKPKKAVTKVASADDGKKAKNGKKAAKKATDRDPKKSGKKNR